MPAYKDEQRGTWYASFYYTDWRGSRKLKKKRGFSRKKDAEEYEREFLRKEAGTCDMSFASMTELYLKDMGPRLRESTVVMKKSVIEKWVLPFFGEMKINEISPTAVRRVAVSPPGGKAGAVLRKDHPQPAFGHLQLRWAIL